VVELKKQFIELTHTKFFHEMMDKSTLAKMEAQIKEDFKEAERQFDNEEKFTSNRLLKRLMTFDYTKQIKRLQSDLRELQVMSMYHSMAHSPQPRARMSNSKDRKQLTRMMSSMIVRANDPSMNSLIASTTLLSKQRSVMANLNDNISADKKF